MIKEVFKLKDYAIGTWCEIPTPYVSNILGKAGLDIQIIDMEHGIVNFETIQNMVFAMRCEGGHTLVRVSSIDEDVTLRVLDMGIDGVIYPKVKNKEDIKKIIKYTKYSPVGEKGFNPFVSASGYQSVDKQYFKQYNKNLLLGIIVENMDAISNIDEILGFEEVDLVYIGQYDLSVALGIPGEVHHKKVLDAMFQLVDKINKKNKIAGCMVHSVEDAKKLNDAGFRFLVYKVDTSIVLSGYHEFIKGLADYDK